MSRCAGLWRPLLARIVSPPPGTGHGKWRDDKGTLPTPWRGPQPFPSRPGPRAHLSMSHYYCYYYKVYKIHSIERRPLSLFSVQPSGVSTTTQNFPSSPVHICP